MATVTPTAITLNGVVVTYSNASGGGDKVKPGDDVFLLVKNGSGASVNVTISGVGKTGYDVDLPDKVVAVAAGADKAIPLLPAYGDPDDSGLASIAWSSTTTVTFAALRI